MALITAVVALVGAALIAVGAALVHVPAGLIVGGVELVAAAYVARYLQAAS